MSWTARRRAPLVEEGALSIVGAPAERKPWRCAPPRRRPRPRRRSTAAPPARLRRARRGGARPGDAAVRRLPPAGAVEIGGRKPPRDMGRPLPLLEQRLA